MKIVITGVLFFLALGSTSLLGVDFSLDSEGFDFGITEENLSVTHLFWGRISGTDTVRIREIKTGCGCLAAVTDSFLYSQEDSLLVTITWNTGKGSNRASQTAYLFSDISPDPVRISLSAKKQDSGASIDNLIYLSRRVIEFDQYSDLNEVAKSAVTMKNMRDETATIEIIAAYPPELNVSIPDSLPPGVLGKLEAVWSTDDNPDYETGSITLEASTRGEVFRTTLGVRFISDNSLSSRQQAKK